MHGVHGPIRAVFTEGNHFDTKTRPVEHTQTRDETCLFLQDQERKLRPTPGYVLAQARFGGVTQNNGSFVAWWTDGACLQSGCEIPIGGLWSQWWL